MNKLYGGLLLLLLLTTFSLGILLVQTMGERDVATSELGNAKAIIKEKDGQLRDGAAAKEALQEDVGGCRAEIKSLNEKASEQAATGQTDKDSADSRANEQLSTLPTQIEQDKVKGQGPTLATHWLKELFVK